MLLQIVLHTPHWVFAVFFLLLWLGARQGVANVAGLARVALMPTLPSPAGLPTLENPTGPNNITVIQAGNGAVTPLMSLNGTGVRHGLTGTDFAPPSAVVGDAGPHLPPITKPAVEATPERRSALRRLIDGIRGR